MPKRYKKPPIPIFRNDGTQYTGEEFEAMRVQFDRRFGPRITKFTIRCLADREHIEDIVSAAIIQGMALAVSGDNADPS